MSGEQKVKSKADDEAETIIRIEDLEKYFTENDSWLTKLHPWREVKHVRAVDGVNMSIKQGETRGLVGESGCGKSTLARLITRLEEPTSGSIVIDGEDITEKGESEMRKFRKKVQIIFQDPFSSLNPRYTVRRTLTEPMSAHGIGDSRRERNARAVELITDVGLEPEHLDRYPHEFSGGQRQRIGIARALAVDPEILIADEPTSALDVSIQADILEMIDRIQGERDLTILFISHDLSVVRYVSDNISVMYLGQLVETASANEVYSDPKHPYAQMLMSSIPPPDPTSPTEFHVAEGQVPDPINPPPGCRFHTRCPEVIQPESLSLDQSVWRDMVNFKIDVRDEEVLIDDVRSRIEERGRDQFIEEEFGSGIDEESARTLRSALDHLVDGERESAISVLNETFSSPCETEPPSSRDVEDHSVKCHLYGE